MIAQCTEDSAISLIWPYFKFRGLIFAKFHGLPSNLVHNTIRNVSLSYFAPLFSLLSGEGNEDSFLCFIISGRREA